MKKVLTKVMSLLLIATLMVPMVSACGKKEVQDIVEENVVYDDNYRNYYEIFVYSFYDSDGDGIGDLNGVTQKLDYIKDMGFNGIWLMPIMPSDTYHKYDVIDYCAVDQRYGTIEDFDRLVEECHKRDIKLIIDMVINHSSSKNKWFIDACAYLRKLKDGEPDPNECPYVEYYHFSRKREDSTYYDIRGCDWYYEGSFWSEMPDLNLACEALRSELENVASFWIEHGVDGFRMDAPLHFEENDTAFNTETLGWFYGYCKNLNPDFYMVSEVWAGEDTIADYYESHTPSMFNFSAAGAEGSIVNTAKGVSSATKFVDTMIRYQDEFSQVYPDYIDAPFISNHDMPRPANALMAGENAMKFAGGLLMTMNGSVFVYYGEEIGLASKGTKDENKRIPMLWSSTDATGITKGPADMDSDIKAYFPAVDVQLTNETSLLNYYKKALSIRNTYPEIARGSITKVEALCDTDVAAIIKTLSIGTGIVNNSSSGNSSENAIEDKELVIAIIYNSAKESRSVDISNSELEGMEIVAYLTTDNSEIKCDGNIIDMPAQSICFLKAR